MNLDHVFITIAGDPDSNNIVSVEHLAVVRTNHKGQLLAGCTATVGTDNVSKLIASEILDGRDTEYVIVCYGNAIVRPAVERECPDLFNARAWLDISQLAWPFAYTDMISARDLETLTRYFDGSNPDPGSARGDCEATVRVYWEMMRRQKLALKGEDTVRALGGTLFQDIRNMVGF